MKSKLAVVLSAVLLVVGCGDDPAQAEFERKKELLELQMEHELAMEREATRRAAAENPVSHTYVENEYEYEVSGENQAPQAYSRSYADEPVHHTVDDDSDGYSGTDLALAATAGVAAGYIANELLDSGYRSVTDANGNQRYYNNKGVEIKRHEFEDHKRKNPVKSKARELTVKGREAASRGANKVRETGKKVAASEPVQGAKETAKKASKTVAKAAKKAKKKLKKKKKEKSKR